MELTQVEGVSHLQVVSPGARDYEMEMQPDGTYAVRELNPDALRGTGDGFVRTTNAEYGVAGDAVTNGISYTASAQTAGYIPSTMDVLVVYTLNRTAGTNDLLHGLTLITLAVTNLGGTFQVGDVFKPFSAASCGVHSPS